MTIATVETHISDYKALQAEHDSLVKALALDLTKTLSTYEIRIGGLKSDSTLLNTTVDVRIIASSVQALLTTRKTSVESQMATIEALF